MPRILTNAEGVIIQPKIPFSTHGCHYIFCHFCPRRRTKSESKRPPGRAVSSTKNQQPTQKKSASSPRETELPSCRWSKNLILKKWVQLQRVSCCGRIKHRDDIFYEKRWAGTWVGGGRIRWKKIGIKSTYKLDKELSGVVE